MRTDGVIRTGETGRRVTALALFAVGVFGLGACATPDALSKVEEDARVTHTMVLSLGEAAQELRRDVTQLRQQLQALSDELSGTIRREEARRQQAIDAVRGQLTSTEERIEALAGAIRGVEMSVGGLSDQVARLEALPPAEPERAAEAQPATAARPAARAAPATADAATASPSRPEAALAKPRERAAGPIAPEELFGRALESFKAGELGQAILDFEDLLGQHPSHALAGSARFWIGEAYYKARDYEHAAAEYGKAVEVAPKGEKTPEALLKMGLAYRALRRHERAREAWSQLVQDFPQSDAAQQARIALRGTSSSGAAPSD